MGVKNCPETPRQRMINMMYLVLTALLALNVAAETLNAFKIVDLSLVKTFESYSRKNVSVMSDFDWQVEKGQKPEMARIYREKAIDVHSSAEAIVSLIAEIKTELAKHMDSKKLVAGEKLPEEYPYIVTKDNDTLILKRQDDLNASPFIMIERGRGEELRNKMIDYKTLLISIIKKDSTLSNRLDPSFFVTLEKILDVSNPAKKDKTTDAKTWVQANFDRTPLIASVTMLSKIQNDVRFAESLVLNVIYSAIRGDSFFEAKVIPKSTYVISEFQNFEAEIFLTALTNVPKAEVYINGSSTPIPLEGSKALYRTSTSKPGKYTYTGEIRYRNPEGLLASAPFKGEYEVAAPTSTISPTKMNVLYRGIDNPIEISVPGLSNSQVRATTDNGSITQNGNEWLSRPTVLNTNTKISVYATIEGKEVLMGFKTFRVKDVPPPLASMSGFTSGAQIPLSFFKAFQVKTLDATLEDFLFDLKFEIVGFDVSVPTGGGMTATAPSKSEEFTNPQLSLIKGVKKGDKLIFENIRAKIKGNNVATSIALSPTIYTVN
jgi:gliding motility-associated protein GldM